MKKSTEGLFQHPDKKNLRDFHPLSFAAVLVCVLGFTVIACGNHTAPTTQDKSTAKRDAPQKPSLNANLHARGEARANQGKLDGRQKPPPGVLDTTGHPCEVTYYFRGSEIHKPILPFGRCTRKGDYMVIDYTEDPPCRAGILAIGIRLNKDMNPTIDEESFVLRQDGRLLKPRIRRLDGKDGWLAQIVWELQPEWRQLRIDTKITRRSSAGEVVPHTARFQLGLFNKSVSWDIFDLDEKNRKAPITAGVPTEICFP